MDLTRPNRWVYPLLAAVWVLVVVWQAEEHVRFREAAKTNLSSRSKDIANTVSACIRGMRFRGAVLQERLEPVLEELVNGGAKDLVKSSELLSIALLNAAGTNIASAGRPIDLNQSDILQRGERWGQHSVTFINPVDLGASLSSEDATNPTLVIPPLHDLTNAFREGRPFRAHEGEPPGGPPPGPPPGEPGLANAVRNQSRPPSASARRAGISHAASVLVARLG